MRQNGSRALEYVLLACGLCVFVPWDPITATNYYEYAMHVAAVRGWQFGANLVSTYGPLGFLALPVFHPDTFRRLIAANIVLYAAGTLWLRRYWRDGGGLGTAPAVWSALVLVLPAFISTPVSSAALHAPFVLVNAFVARHFLSEEDAFTPGEAVMISLLGACCLVKPTLLVVILAAVAIVATDQILFRRRFPWQAAVVVAALLVGWAASGQQFGHAARYLVTSSDIAVGYKDAMSLRSRQSDTLALVFVAAGAVLLAVLVRATWKRLRWRTLGPAAMFAFTTFIVFQHGFTRADAPHILPACLGLAALGLWTLPLLPRGPSPWRPPITAVLSTISLVLVTCWRLGFGAPPFARIFVERVAGVASLATSGTSSLQRARALWAAGLKRDNPLGRLREPVDTSNVDLELAAVNDLATIVQPTRATYVAYTPRLSRLNRDYIESAAGPGAMLLPNKIHPDERYPTVTDSLSLLGLKSHFELTRRTDAYLILQRRARPLPMHLVRLEERRVALDETIPVPDPGSDFLWVTIDLTPTTSGRLFGVAYQPAPVFITVDSEARTATFRLTTAMAREGMILAPVQERDQNLEWLYAPPRSQGTPVVRSLRLGIGRGLAWCYRARVAVAFFRIVVAA